MVGIWTMLAIAAAGFAAGAVNTIVGSGSLISYPVMVLMGVPPVSANIANTVGLVPGSVAGALGYRRQLPPMPRRRLLSLMAASVAGAIVGAWLLTVLPESAFRVIVPFLILLATVLVAFQKRISALAHMDSGDRWAPLLITVFLAGIYGGYFSAAQGVILLGVLGLFLKGSIQGHNAVKNILQAIVNAVAALFFISTTSVDWLAAGLIAGGSILGALGGAWIGTRIPQQGLRRFVIVFGFAMAVVMGVQALHS